MANIKGTPKDAKHRLVMLAAFPQKGEHNGKPMTGYNISFAMAQDRVKAADIEAGKGQTAPMLAYDSYKDKETGEKKLSTTRPYSKDQYDKIMQMANTKGDKPVIEASVFARDGGLIVNTNTIETPKFKFDAEKHKANVEKSREIASKQRDAKENAAEAEMQTEAQADGPEMG